MFVGVDVGTSSARAALVDHKGRIRSVAKKNITVWSPKANFYQQSSEEIWSSVCEVVREVTSGIPKSAIKGIGFDGTTSLVVIGKDDHPVSVSPNGETDQNIIMWLDHRAKTEALAISETRDPFLDIFSNQVPEESAIPKLAWLKKHMRQECWNRADSFFELPDFLTWKATGSKTRSICSLSTRWLFDSSKENAQWNLELFTKIGMEDLLDNHCSNVGDEVKIPGEPCGQGLSLKAATEMELLPGTPVSVAAFDGMVGALSLFGCQSSSASRGVIDRLSVICGTSTCVVAVTDREIHVKGLWGPFYNALIPGLYVAEGGQSACGKLIDHILNTHKATAHIRSKLTKEISIFDYLNNLLEKLATTRGIEVDLLTEGLHIWPDFHGNRSPIGDTSLRGMISGLDLDSNEEQLAVLYLAVMQALAYGVRHIMEVMEDCGHTLDCILMSGGLSKNGLFVQTHANALSRPISVPLETEPVLVGAAMLAATVSGVYPSVETAAINMGGTANTVYPRNIVTTFHDRKYRVFRKMEEHQRLYTKIMEEIDD